MIFYYNSNIDLDLQAKNLLNVVNYQIEYWNKQLEILLECLKQLNYVIQNTDNIEEPKQLTNMLENFKHNLDNTRTIISDLKNLKEMLDAINLELSNTDNAQSNPELICQLNDYNDKATSFWNNKLYLDIGDFILQYVNNTGFKLSQTPPSKSSDLNIDVQEEKNVSTDAMCGQLPKEPIDNNVLLISEIQNKVLLPYKISNLEGKIDGKKYKAVQEIIDSEYTFTLDKYKNASISRFKEAYNLMRKKEKASITDSLDLALELTFKNLLNPAIISACENLDQLDIYLDCLDSNELDKFPFFEIKYEILPR